MLLFNIFLIFSFFAIVPSTLIYFVLKIWKRGKFIKRYFWVPPLLIVAMLLILTFLVDKKLINAYETQLGWTIMLYFMLIFPRLIYAFLIFITSPFRIIWKWKLNKPLFYLSLVLAVIFEFVFIYGTLFGRDKIEVKHFTYESANLPEAFDGYTIAQLSDIHIGGWIGNKDALEKLIQKTNSLHPNLIVFTGDLVNHRTIELDGFESILSQLSAPDGVYSILGNHDYGTYYKYWKSTKELEANFQDMLKRQADMGWELLNNRHVFLHHNNDSIALVGVENEGEPPFSQYANLPQAIKGTEGHFQLLLSHNPSHWRREVLPETDIELMLAGHTHAMQIELLGFSPAVWKYKEWAGPYYKGNQCLYVNVGAGEIGIPFRFGAWPEITLITLKHKK